MWTPFVISALMICATIHHSQAISQSNSHHLHHHHRNHPVLDTEGHEVQAGAPYFMISAIHHGGGVSIDKRGTDSRIPSIRQYSIDKNFGTPVIFALPSDSSNDRLIRVTSSPADSSRARILRQTRATPSPSEQMSIEEDTDLNIRFSGMEKVWQVEEEAEPSSNQTRFVMVRGREGHPGSASTVRNWFKIERIDQTTPGYKIVYCPSLCEACRYVCGTVGIRKVDGKRWLSVSDHGEFPVVFMKERLE